MTAQPTNPIPTAPRTDYQDSWGACLRMLTVVNGCIVLPAMVPILCAPANRPLGIALAGLSARVLRQRVSRRRRSRWSA